MAINYTDGRRTPSNEPDLTDPQEQKKQIRQLDKQKKQLQQIKKKKQELQQTTKELKRDWPLKSAANALRFLASKLKSADTLDFQEFMGIIGDIGIDQRDIETIVTSGRDYQVVLKGDIERELNNLLQDAFTNNNFEQLQYMNNNWIMSFKG